MIVADKRIEISDVGCVIQSSNWRFSVVAGTLKKKKGD